MPFLEHYAELGGPPQRIPLDKLPFRIGRGSTAQYVIPSPQVSREHLEISRAGHEFRVRDLGSTNGTFVNGQRVAEAALADGDIIHVARTELRFGVDQCQGLGQADAPVTVPAIFLPASLIRNSQHLREMIAGASLRVAFQPIVDTRSEAVLGYEALGRGSHPKLNSNPTDLFRLAVKCNLARELSRAFRLAAVEEAARMPDSAQIFLNLHPAEMDREFLGPALRELKAKLPGSVLAILEVHEGAVTDLATMRWLRQEVKSLEMGLAYDDFGTGQSRLAELTEVPPDFIKLDRGLIAGLTGSNPRQELVRSILRLSADLGVEAIAEGIETQEEAQFCQGLGCRYAQGYWFGRPQPAASWFLEPVSGEFELERQTIFDQPMVLPKHLDAAT
jgi:EAL domain-containing protein (putative c-di-GMP-specific phosphodiesterase class I)